MGFCLELGMLELCLIDRLGLSCCSVDSKAGLKGCRLKRTRLEGLRLQRLRERLVRLVNDHRGWLVSCNWRLGYNISFDRCDLLLPLPRINQNLLSLSLYDRHLAIDFSLRPAISRVTFFYSRADFNLRLVILE